jgi:hypothetical protein
MSEDALMQRLASLLLLVTPLCAYGRCGQTLTVCSEYDSTPIIFRGRVIEVIPDPPAPPTEVTNPDGSKTLIYPLSGTGQWDQVRFKVLEVFKGNPGSEITVSGADQIFHDGGEFLVYATTYGNMGYSAPFCSRTGSVANPYIAADLDWLRAYPTAPPTASIFGLVYMGYGVTDIPVISVTLTGAATTRTASSDASHNYSFKDLPPGAYTVTAVPPAGYTTLDKPTASVSVAAKSCAEVDWAIRHDTHIRGTVTDASGDPVPNAKIGLLSPSDSRTGYDVVDSRGTDAAGHYDFSKADPEDYWVALYYDGPDENQPYVPVYYPSGSSQSSAQLIHLGAAESQDNINLVLGSVLHPVTVRLRVSNPDGSPVSNATVVANDPVSPVHSLYAKADSNGDADITLYEGREYRLVANGSGNHEPACAGPVKFVAKEGLQLGTLKLDKSIQECRAQQKPN